MAIDTIKVDVKLKYEPDLTNEVKLFRLTKAFSSLITQADINRLVLNLKSDTEEIDPAFIEYVFNHYQEYLINAFKLAFQHPKKIARAWEALSAFFKHSPEQGKRLYTDMKSAINYKLLLPQIKDDLGRGIFRREYDEKNILDYALQYDSSFAYEALSENRNVAYPADDFAFRHSKGWIHGDAVESFKLKEQSRKAPWYKFWLSSRSESILYSHLNKPYIDTELKQNEQSSEPSKNELEQSSDTLFSRGVAWTLQQLGWVDSNDKVSTQPKIIKSGPLKNDKASDLASENDDVTDKIPASVSQKAWSISSMLSSAWSSFFPDNHVEKQDISDRNHKQSKAATFRAWIESFRRKPEPQSNAKVFEMKPMVDAAKQNDKVEGADESQEQKPELAASPKPQTKTEKLENNVLANSPQSQTQAPRPVSSPQPQTQALGPVSSPQPQTQALRPVLSPKPQTKTNKNALADSPQPQRIDDKENAEGQSRVRKRLDFGDCQEHGSNNEPFTKKSDPNKVPHGKSRGVLFAVDLNNGTLTTLEQNKQGLRATTVPLAPQY